VRVSVSCARLRGRAHPRSGIEAWRVPGPYSYTRPRVPWPVRMRCHRGTPQCARCGTANKLVGGTRLRTRGSRSERHVGGGGAAHGVARYCPTRNSTHTPRTTLPFRYLRFCAEASCASKLPELHSVQSVRPKVTAHVCIPCEVDRSPFPRHACNLRRRSRADHLVTTKPKLA